MSKTFRSGALGALMDEYDRAASEIAHLVNDFRDAEFVWSFDAREETTMDGGYDA